jgi:hypothetical protein
MNISSSVIVPLLALVVDGCADRAPHPAALIQPTDPHMDCEAISIEAQANNTKLQALGVESGNKVAQNVTAEVAGLFIWPLWFAMDFQDAPGKEVVAVNSRNQYLAAIAAQQNCGVPTALVAQYPVQTQPADAEAVYRRPPAYYTRDYYRPESPRPVVAQR